MVYKFVQQTLSSGLYEPEGIYLTPPFEGQATILQFWAEHHDLYAGFTYSSIPLKGHPGIDFAIPPATHLLAVDHGRVVEIGYETGGFERYLKVEHRWGESFYAYVGDHVVEAGQMLVRGEPLAYSSDPRVGPSFLHFAIRVIPYNRLMAGVASQIRYPIWTHPAYFWTKREPMSLTVSFTLW
ncbi:MAG: M23 family metallopeptidase [Caldilineaceae bacterium]|nr:M23 family metallopeptidase [Caldilineaceae bacterium]